MHQQLPHIPHLQARHPDPRKPIRTQQIQQMFRVPPVRLLLPPPRTPPPRRTPHPQPNPYPPQHPPNPRIDSVRKPPPPPALLALPANRKTAPPPRGAATASLESLPFACQRSRP